LTINQEIKLRNNTIDLFRLIASFSVITLHAGSYGDISQTFGEIIRLSGRWAVPFFFLVTGAFIAINKKEKSCNEQAIRILRIFLVSSLIFFPYALIQNSEYLSIISFLGVFSTGTYFHLWFLSSLVMGLIFFKIFNTYFPILIIPTSAFLLLLYILTDIYTCIPHKELFDPMIALTRHATSFSFISIGYLFIHKNIINMYSFNTKGVLLVILFFGLFFLEPFISYEITDSKVIQRQFPVFTPIIAIIILIFSFKVNTKSNLLSEAGRDYSLGIYLVHPIFLPIFSTLFSNLNVGYSILNVIMTFIASWIFVAFLKNKIPLIFNLLNGISKNKPKSLEKVQTFKGQESK